MWMLVVAALHHQPKFRLVNVPPRALYADHDREIGDSIERKFARENCFPGWKELGSFIRGSRRKGRETSKEL